jgi:hypothetical protein
MKTSTRLAEKLETFLNLLISYGTGGRVDDDDFKRLRTELVNDPALNDRLPRFVRTCRDLKQYWAFIKRQSATYQGRREYLWSEFNPLIDELDETRGSPSDKGVEDAVAAFGSDAVHEAWRDALHRRIDDPDGAITSARTLLESVCKHILDARREPYKDGFDLPRLYQLTAKSLSLAPSQQTEGILRQIAGSCSTVVEGIGALRNALGDAHGKGQGAVRAEQRHAELAVNLAGALAIFLVETWEAVEDSLQATPTDGGPAAPEP